MGDNGKLPGLLSGLLGSRSGKRDRVAKPISAAGSGPAAALPAKGRQDPAASTAPPTPGGGAASRPSVGGGQEDEATVDLERRRDQLRARVAELQWDLGGLVYEMAIREQLRVEVIVKRAAVLQGADAELGEVERILRMEQTATAGACPNCSAPHSTGAAFCWQCGHSLLRQVSSDAIFAP